MFVPCTRCVCAWSAAPPLGAMVRSNWFSRRHGATETITRRQTRHTVTVAGTGLQSRSHGSRDCRIPSFVFFVFFVVTLTRRPVAEWRPVRISGRRELTLMSVRQGHGCASYQSDKRDGADGAPRRARRARSWELTGGADSTGIAEINDGWRWSDTQLRWLAPDCSTSMAQPITRFERLSNSILRALRVLRVLRGDSYSASSL